MSLWVDRRGGKPPRLEAVGSVAFHRWQTKYGRAGESRAAERVAGIHVVLPQPSPNDDVADFEPGLRRSRNAGEEDFGDAEIRNQVRCRGGRSDFAPSRKGHHHG